MVGEIANMEVKGIAIWVKVAGVVAGAEVVNPWANFEVEVHPNHPLYFHPSDNPAMSPISMKLTEPENYAMRSRAMLVTL